MINITPPLMLGKNTLSVVSRTLGLYVLQQVWSSCVKAEHTVRQCSIHYGVIGTPYLNLIKKI